MQANLSTGEMPGTTTHLQASLSTGRSKPDIKPPAEASPPTAPCSKPLAACTVPLLPTLHVPARAPAASCARVRAGAAAAAAAVGFCMASTTIGSRASMVRLHSLASSSVCTALYWAWARAHTHTHTRTAAVVRFSAEFNSRCEDAAAGAAVLGACACRGLSCPCCLGV
eukprot:1143774-Pelagomonas_calceolata.AAC.4